MHKAVMGRLDHLHLLSNVQHGFRKERSCETQLSAVIHDIAYSLGLSQQVDAIILDFSKAFDTVPHHHLLYRLDQYGIRGNTLQTEISYQTIVSQCSGREVFLQGSGHIWCATGHRARTFTIPYLHKRLSLRPDING